ncbi:MAG: LysE family translocator [Bacteroidales bacterium]|nr:LysE family translocator [Bacteroidales bacterium]
MDITFIIKGVAIGILVSIPVGPVAVLAIQRSLNKGFKSGFITGIGAASADIVYAVIAGFSITFISDFLIENQTYIRIIGGLFLILIGYRIFISNPAKQIRKLRTKGNNYYKDFFTSFLVTVSNPLTILAFGAIFASFNMVDKESGTFSVFILIITVFSGAAFWWIALTAITTIFKNKIRLRNLLWINRITGVLIVLFAVLLIISAFIPETSDLGTQFQK